MFLHTHFSGIHEADGNERVDILGVLVLQVSRLHDHCCNINDGRFAFESRRWSGGLTVRRPNGHIRVSAALWAFIRDLRFRHLNIFFNRYDY